MTENMENVSRMSARYGALFPFATPNIRGYSSSLQMLGSTREQRTLTIITIGSLQTPLTIENNFSAGPLIPQEL